MSHDRVVYTRPLSRGRAVRRMSGAVSRSDYIVGDRFTAADDYVGAQISWGMQLSGREKRPAFERCVARVNERPAAVRARQIGDGLIAGAAAPVAGSIL